MSYRSIKQLYRHIDDDPNDLRNDRYEIGIVEGSYPTHIAYSNLD